MLARLTGWLAGVYLRYADAARTVPACWLWHPEVVEELPWPRQAWLAAYADPDAPVSLAADWHDRLRPGVVRRIRDYAGMCSIEADHRHPDRAVLDMPTAAAPPSGGSPPSPPCTNPSWTPPPFGARVYGSRPVYRPAGPTRGPAPPPSSSARGRASRRWVAPMSDQGIATARPVTIPLAGGEGFRFFLGTHQPGWLASVGVPSLTVAAQLVELAGRIGRDPGVREAAVVSWQLLPGPARSRRRRRSRHPVPRLTRRRQPLRRRVVRVRGTNCCAGCAGWRSFWPRTRRSRCPGSGPATAAAVRTTRPRWPMSNRRASRGCPEVRGTSGELPTRAAGQPGPGGAPRIIAPVTGKDVRWRPVAVEPPAGGCIVSGRARPRN